LTNIEYFTAVA